MISHVENIGFIKTGQSFPENMDWNLNIKSTIWRPVKYKLSGREIRQIIYWLKQLSKAFESKAAQPQELTTIRLNLAYADQLLYSRIGRSDRAHSNVEHFNQNKTHTYKSVEELLGEEWMR